MKFRAKIVDTACLNHFTRVSNMIAKLAKTCTLRISPDKLNFVLSDKVANGGVSMWCELEQENFFSEFQMEGVSAENNEIYLELTSENLSRALKTAQNARALKVKLTNKHFPCITVSIELLSVSSSSRVVTHDIPVKVIPRKLWKDLQEPTVPDADVSIYLPVLKTMKSVVEKMKNISNHLELHNVCIVRAAGKASPASPVFRASYCTLHAEGLLSGEFLSPCAQALSSLHC
ncbi:PREDICTED: checkpoint protein HUS1 isoform X2 [Capra hircus]|uniref:checkpoint protein HUS1 isoform X2 n=1 Tax=Capra hircus TaxID=9925 RepID=UPI000847BDAB|nr:PREDICTED: checkpoint protein HUS1 isoform X2 [Capra hircus]